MNSLFILPVHTHYCDTAIADTGIIWMQDQQPNLQLTQTFGGGEMIKTGRFTSHIVQRVNVSFLKEK